MLRNPYALALAPVLLVISACETQPEQVTSSTPVANGDTDPALSETLDQVSEGGDGTSTEAPEMMEADQTSPTTSGATTGTMASGSNSDDTRQPDRSRSKLIKADPN